MIKLDENQINFKIKLRKKDNYEAHVEYENENFINQYISSFDFVQKDNILLMSKLLISYNSKALNDK